MSQFFVLSAYCHFVQLKCAPTWIDCGKRKNCSYLGFSSLFWCIYSFTSLQCNKLTARRVSQWNFNNCPKTNRDILLKTIFANDNDFSANFDCSNPFKSWVSKMFRNWSVEFFQTVECHRPWSVVIILWLPVSCLRFSGFAELTKYARKFTKLIYLTGYNLRSKDLGIERLQTLVPSSVIWIPKRKAPYSRYSLPNWLIDYGENAKGRKGRNFDAEITFLWNMSE